MNTAYQPIVINIHLCRVCRSGKLERFVHLPKMPFTDNFIARDQLGNEFCADIDIFVCTACLTAQTQHNVEIDIYYEDYQYSVGNSIMASRFMHTLAKNVQSKYYPKLRGKKVLEIGSGDGQQLLAFRETGCSVLGYEPSSVLCHVAKSKGIDTIQGLFSSDSISRLPDDFREVDVVVLSYTFDHLPDPRGFLEICHSILNKKSGLLVVEVHDLEKIIERQEYCLFEHEHSIYLTEATAHQLCRMEGFEIIDFQLVGEEERRANSLIFVATPKYSQLSVCGVQPKTSEEYANLCFYQQVGGNIQQGIFNLELFINRMAESGKKVAGYGAGGRGVMTLAAISNSSKISYLVDKNPKCINFLAPKSGVPLVGLEALKSDPVDIILVFSFGYMKEIQEEVCVFGYSENQFYSLIDILAGRF